MVYFVMSLVVFSKLEKCHVKQKMSYKDNYKFFVNNHGCSCRQVIILLSVTAVPVCECDSVTYHICVL